MTKLGFVGAGKMATALTKGVLAKGVFEKENICGADISADARKKFEEQTGANCVSDAQEVVAWADVIVLAVKPQTLYDTVQPLVKMMDGKLVISIAAGIPLDSLINWISHRRIVRVMPNTPLRMGLGASAFATASEVKSADRDLVSNIFGSVGLAIEIEEEKLNAVTALSGSGPAYVFDMLEGLTKAGVNAGVPEDTAQQLAAQTLKGAAEMVLQGEGSPQELRDAVASKGGTTAEGLRILNENCFHDILAETVEAARNRAEELGRGE